MCSFEVDNLVATLLYEIYLIILQLLLSPTKATQVRDIQRTNEEVKKHLFKLEGQETMHLAMLGVIYID